MQYVFWTQKEVANGCRLRGCEGFDDDWMLMDGVTVTDEFPEDVTFPMNPNFPDNTLIPDCPYNLDRLLIVSTRLKEFLESRNLPDVEYLQVGIVDLKGKTAKPPHFIVNPVGTRPLLRVDQCDATMSSLDDSSIEKLKRFVIDEKALDGAPPLFRIQNLSRYLMVSKDLAREVEKAGFTGARFIQPEALANGNELGSLAELPKEATAQL
ncbi:MAG: DUF1629 domain-containing protein [Polyangiaceae bacterium]